MLNAASVHVFNVCMLLEFEPKLSREDIFRFSTNKYVQTCVSLIVVAAEFGDEATDAHGSDNLTLLIHKEPAPVYCSVLGF